MQVNLGKILVKRNKVQFEVDRDLITIGPNEEDRKRERPNCVILYLHVHQSSKGMVNGSSVCGTDSARATSCFVSKIDVSHAHRLAIAVGCKSENVA